MASINYSGFGIYNADVCLCIDRSVCNNPLYSTLVGNLSRIRHDINTVFEEKATLLTNLRIRFVFFGNNYGDDQSIIQSPFFMPYEQEQISNFIHRSRVHPANGMEALECAMKSEWCAEGWRKRHIIVLITENNSTGETLCGNGLSLTDCQNEQAQMYEKLTK